jgi:hypothetical protein
MFPNREYWKTLPGPRLLNLIIAVSALAIAYEGMSQGVMGAVNVAPDYGVSLYLLRADIQAGNRPKVLTDTCK